MYNIEPTHKKYIFSRLPISSDNCLLVKNKSLYFFIVVLTIKLHIWKITNSLLQSCKYCFIILVLVALVVSASFFASMFVPDLLMKACNVYTVMRKETLWMPLTTIKCVANSQRKWPSFNEHWLLSQ